MSEETKAANEQTEVSVNAVPEVESPTATEVEAAVDAMPSPEEVNAANAARSTGKVSDDGQGAAFFTSADVRAMSREQVRRNLSKILKSMESDKF